MKYYYSRSTGMSTLHDDAAAGSETEEEAILKFYVQYRNDLTKEINQLSKAFNKKQKEIKDLDEKFGSLRELYPEEFI